MRLFRKTLHEKEFVDICVKWVSKMELLISEELTKKYGTPKNIVKFHFEIYIFSLWVVSISIPFRNSNFMSMVCEATGDRIEAHLAGLRLPYYGKEGLFDEIDRRHQIYFEAFKMWQRNPQEGHFIGAAMIDMICHQNYIEELSEIVDDDIPDVEAVHAFNIFASLFEQTVEFVSEIKKIYRTKYVIAES